MRRTLGVFGASLLFCLATAGTAAALDPPSGPTFGQTQSSSQDQAGSNSVSQTAASEAISAPGAQINVNLPISLLSDGNNGAVEQSNDSSATSSASNDSTAIQGIDQSQGSEQTQDGSQSAGCCTGGSPSFDQGQDSTQSQDARNSIDQNASSKAVSAPGAQINVNAPIRIASDGDNGPVTQSNRSSADSSATNTSFAKQGIEQEQSSTQDQDGKQVVGSGDNGHEGYHGSKGKDCGCGEHGSGPSFDHAQDSSQSQTGSNSVSQNADSKAISKPGKQVSLNAPLRLGGHSCGCEPSKHKGKVKDGKGKDLGAGPVDQSNTSAADSSASNTSWAAQGVGQSQASGQLQKGLQRL